MCARRFFERRHSGPWQEYGKDRRQWKSAARSERTSRTVGHFSGLNLMIHFLRHGRGIVLSVLAVMLCLGCVNRPGGRVGDGAEITIPFFNSSFRGVIAPPAAKQSEAMITIFVRGQVVNPGQYKVREGSSILEAVQAAGGFTPYAATWAVTLVDERERLRLRLYRDKRFSLLPLVWYGKQNGSDIVVLKDGMTIVVPMCL
jgi:hypothetical protein